MSKKVWQTITIDFDGVLHSYKSGWKGADVIPDEPVECAKEFIEEALDNFIVAIYSARSGQTGGIDAMREWMRKHGFPVDHERLEFPTVKPSALWGLDDRVDRFTGQFPEMEYIKNFKPWNKRSL